MGRVSYDTAKEYAQQLNKMGESTFDTKQFSEVNRIQVYNAYKVLEFYRDNELIATIKVTYGSQEDCINTVTDKGRAFIIDPTGFLSEVYKIKHSKMLSSSQKKCVVCPALFTPKRKDQLTCGSRKCVDYVANHKRLFIKLLK